ncbi:ABC transporter substrate-binding protein [Photobacterium sp. 1_MG-2023]|uniref:ABC transporter substrate-binding protein n=1 Tax=Photobacterium sp. 1_MG-2023 TaxID=3062646 RepID=UPI0026E3BD5C|nr:ABC transporter substrate-binding protein [Photobacterium sp. 1_MG-2023]MDO6704596.1 ABC transporter substrate-binding protein [Photobacterium sp. 1_MG-2023]
MFKWLLSTLLLFSGLAGATEKNQLVILTTYNPAHLSPSIDSFRQQHPQLDVQVLQRRESDGLALLSTPNHGIDVVFSSSTRLFQPLTEQNALVPVRHMIAERGIHDTEQVAVLGYSGCGMIWNQRYLDRHQLPPPEQWEMLSNALYHDHLVMSSPSRSTTTHQMVENLLQRHGWDQGWQILLQVGGNLNAVTANSERVSNIIASGQAGIGLVIDSYAKAQQALFPFVEFRYQPKSLILPGFIAALDRSADDPAGQLFVRFMLSDDIQARIHEAPLYKMSRNQQPDFGVSPFPLDHLLLQQRAMLVQQLFDLSISKQLPLLSQAWRLIHEIRQSGDLSDSQQTQLALAVALASTPVINAEQASSPRFTALNDPIHDAAAAQIFEQLQQTMSQQLQKSILLSQEILMAQRQTP